MEEKKHTEQPIMQQEERQQPPPPTQNVVIANGLIIQSKLNPAAKEFYPSHLMRRNQMFQEIIKETKSSEEILGRMQNDFAESAGCGSGSGSSGRVRECSLLNFCEKVETPKINFTPLQENETLMKTEPKLQQQQQQQHVSEELTNIENSNLNTNLKFLINKTAVADNNDVVLFKNEKSKVEDKKEATAQNRPIEECVNNADSLKNTQCITGSKVDNFVDDKVYGDCLTVSEEKKEEEKRQLEIKAVAISEDKSIFAQKTEDDDMAALIKKIEEEIDADEENKTSNTEENKKVVEPLTLEQTNDDAVKGSTKANNTKTEPSLKGIVKTVGTAKTMGTVKSIETANTMEMAKTVEKAKASEVCKAATIEVTAPKPAAKPVEKLKTTEIFKAAAKQKVSTVPTATSAPNVAGAKEKVEKTISKEPVKASAPLPPVKKEGSLRKISKIALSSIKKTTSSTSSQSTTSTNSGHGGGEKLKSPRTTSSSNMTRTKRISESLHNLSNTFKSKTDIKTADTAAAAKPTQRSSTTIQKTAVRSRTLINKTSDTNGVKKTALPANVKVAPTTAAAKDAVSLKSTSSTEKSITSKSSLTPSTHSGSSKILHNKISTTSTKSSDSKSSTSSKNSKDSTQKVPPRGTVASSLRQTEAQKRRNLFPYDDPETNIELSQFLFK